MEWQVKRTFQKRQRNLFLQQKLISVFTKNWKRMNNSGGRQRRWRWSNLIETRFIWSRFYRWFGLISCRSSRSVMNLFSTSSWTAADSQILFFWKWMTKENSLKKNNCKTVVAFTCLFTWPPTYFGRSFHFSIQRNPHTPDMNLAPFLKLNFHCIFI